MKQNRNYSSRDAGERALNVNGSNEVTCDNIHTRL